MVVSAEALPSWCSVMDKREGRGATVDDLTLFFVDIQLLRYVYVYPGNVCVSVCLRAAPCLSLNAPTAPMPLCDAIALSFCVIMVLYEPCLVSLD
jgi:hypothetical protein